MAAVGDDHVIALDGACMYVHTSVLSAFYFYVFVFAVLNYCKKFMGVYFRGEMERGVSLGMVVSAI